MSNKSELSYDYMKSFFEPASIAIIGASDDPRKPGGRPQRALTNKGYQGKIYPVNPKYQQVMGLTCYPSLMEIPGPVDLVIISVPAAGVYQALEQCAAKGVKAAVIFTSGFAETGHQGRLAQQQILDLARQHGIRLCGPNSLGLINTQNGVAASFAWIVDAPDVGNGTLGFVTQSGAFGALIYAQALHSGIGLNYFVSVGNEADLEFADFVGYMVQDDATLAIGGYMEGAKDGDKLRQVAEQAAEAGKPLLLLKVGQSKAGARAASSHTGSLAGEDRIYEAFFRQTGIVRIEAPEELISFMPLFLAGRLPRGRNVALINTSGGSGVTLADSCERLGLTVPALGERTRARMEKVMPFYASAQNPVDMTAAYVTNPEILITCLQALAEDEDVDMIMANFDLKEPYGEEIARMVIEVYQQLGKPLVVAPWVLPGTDEGEGVRALRRAGIPLLLDMNQTVKALAHLANYAEFLTKRGQQAYRIPEPGEQARALARRCTGLKGALSEGQSKEVLAAFGIPVSQGGLAVTREEAVVLAEQIGYPVVLKIDSPDISHKTEAGGVLLDLKSAQAVQEAYDKILDNVRNYNPAARINGVLVQEMLPQGIEVIVGITNDDVFGPTVMFGLGGIFVEVLQDVAFRVAPFSPGDALEMIREIKGYRVLEGVRGGPPADLEALVEVLVRVSELAVVLGDRIEELDINPLVVYPAGQGVRAADALLVFRDSD